MNELALFAGAGGGILGGKLLGWRTVCAIEIDAYARSVLLARQRDGMLDPFPIWDDVRTFDGRAWCGNVDVISGGFPCNDISSVGYRDGIEGQKSGLWKEMARIIGEVRPHYVFVENVADLIIRGLGTVLGDLATLGYDAEWGVLGAHQVGAWHRRERAWIIAAHPDRVRRKASETTPRAKSIPDGRDWWSSEPELGRVAHGIPNWVDRLRALGMAQVPGVAATAFLEGDRRLNEVT